MGNFGRMSHSRSTGINRLLGRKQIAPVESLFCAEWYTAAYPDVLASGTLPAEHFMTVGWAEGRKPHALFDTEWYLRQNPDVESSGINPLLHYVTGGWKEGRRPNPLFDVNWYLDENPEVREAGMEPLFHYISKGAKAGRWPNPVFDPESYSKAAAGSVDAGTSPLEHYLTKGWKAGLRPHPLFHPKWYRKKSKIANTVEPLGHFLNTARPASPHPLFDIDWYRLKYHDISTCGMNPLFHYISAGWREGRDPSPWFDTKAYVASNPGLKVGENPLQHYLLKGGFEGRNPSRRFKSAFYLDRYTDVRSAGINPLEHYLVSGLGEGRLPTAKKEERLGAYEYCSEYASTHNGSVTLLAEGGVEAECRLAGTLAVHLHLFHADMVEMFARAFHSIPCRFDLFVSVAEGADPASIKRPLEAVEHVNKVVVECQPNRGRDIGPMMVGFGDRLSKYDFILHLHSKKSDHTPGKRDWASHLLHHLLHSRAHFTRVLNLFVDQPTLGLVFPVYHPSIRDQIKWGANFDSTQKLFERMGQQIGKEDLEAFPAGSFFVARMAAVRKLFDLRLSLEDFHEEAGQKDGTLAHAIERAWPIVCERQLFANVQVRAEKPHSLSTSYLRGDKYRSPLLNASTTPEEFAPRTFACETAKGLKITFFSCATGGYDVPLPYEGLVQDAQYVFYGDKVPARAWNWTGKPLEFASTGATRTARVHKAQPHKLLPDTDIAVWVDGNVIANGNIAELIDKVVAADAGFGVVPHPYRTSAYQEAELLIKLSRDEPEVINRQIARYKAESMSADAGLTETNFLIMDIRRPEVRKALDIWCEELSQGSFRDQLSFDYAVWKAGAKKVDLISDGLTVRANSKFSYFPHGGDGHPFLERIRQLPVVAAAPVQQPAPVPVKKEVPAVVPGTVTHTAAVRTKHDITVDVIVCVHNSPDDVARCLRSVALARDSRTRVVIVDDGSDPPTQRVIGRYLERNPGDLLVRHEQAKGYTKAANAGMRSSDRDYMILLNSDTIVPENWVETLVSAGESDPKVGILGPLSNAASWQSVPETQKPDGDFAVNELPEWMSVSEMAAICRSVEGPEVYRAPVTNGFCFAIKRQVTDAIGFLDEASFPHGYGEENDLCFRALDAGFTCGFTTRTYIFHAKSKSFNHERRLKLSKVGFEKLIEKHSIDRLKQAVGEMKQHPALERARQHVRARLKEDKRTLKPVCFYLPQFHPFDINDKAWGEGFTEWRNVVKAEPRHDGHFQPRLPGKLGYYDLRLPETLRAQAELAARAGVFGFAVYYYRFGAERVMGRPTDVILENGDIPFRFYYCWANEDWTRAWDGKTSDVILKQDYSEDTIELVVADLLHACADPRYIRVDDRPVFAIYQLNKLPDPAATIARIRQRMREETGSEILVATTYNDEFKPEWAALVDMVAQFPPHRIPRAKTRHLIPRSEVAGSDHEKQDFFERYSDVVDHALSGVQLVPKLHPGVCPDWDNSPRRAKNANILVGSDPAAFSAWVAEAAHFTLQKYSDGEIVAPFLFVNAWNEWAEGAMLEPSEKLGDAYLVALRKGIDLAENLPISPATPKAELAISKGPAVGAQGTVGVSAAASSK